MDRLRLIIAWLACLIYWVTGGTAFLILGAFLKIAGTGEAGTRIGQAALKHTFRGFRQLLVFFDIVEVEYRGFERLASYRGGFVLAPNHPAMWDAVFVLAEVDHLACVLKASLMCNPIVAGGATAAGFIPNQPTHKMLRRCVDVVKSGGRLLFFPEGTRTRSENGKMNPPVGGIAVVARQGKVPVWPVYVRTNSRYLSKGWPLWRLPTEKVRVQMTLGDPVSYGDEDSAQPWLENLRQQYIEALEVAPSPALRA